MFLDRYNKGRWDGNLPSEIFRNLGEKKAEEMYNKYIEQGMSDEDAWLEVYSAECNLDVE